MTKSHNAKQGDVSSHIMKDPVHYEVLLESMNDGFAIIDTDGFLTYVNSRFSDMVNYGTKEILGKHVTTFAETND